MFTAIEVPKLMLILTILETRYCKAGVTPFCETRLSMVNKGDVISVGRLKTEFGCILVPMYPYGCTCFTNVEQYEQVRAEVKGFWIR